MIKKLDTREMQTGKQRSGKKGVVWDQSGLESPDSNSRAFIEGSEDRNEERDRPIMARETLVRVRARLG